VFGDLIGRTVLLLSLATALVAVSIAVDLPRTGATAGAGRGGHDDDATPHVPITSEAAFLAGAIAHHQEAVDTARVAAERGERPEVRALARGVVATQAEEIAGLRAWLAAWYPEAPAAAPYAPMMRTLTGLTPPEVDRVFVADMIRHHETAVAMAEEALALDPGPRPEVAALARTIVRQQGEEIATLRGWLDDWGAPAP